ncbi:hypothetical protein NQD34_008485 [Periophthalmus magnuspinnatus]|nr:hypothetical protein NQD34_008485 [Periophthalmus magnuspinnatus]
MQLFNLHFYTKFTTKNWPDFPHKNYGTTSHNSPHKDTKRTEDDTVIGIQTFRNSTRTAACPIAVANNIRFSTHCLQGEEQLSTPQLASFVKAFDINISTVTRPEHMKKM